MEASIVVGTGFGDEGKGITTDWLLTEPNVKDIVVRYNGGQQAGHTVVYRGKRHTCSNYGAGTLKGVPTYISDYCTFYPNTIYQEQKVLKANDIWFPELTIHPLAKVTTPYDVAWNRMLERIYGHGSCGLGIGATMSRNENSCCKFFAIDLLNKDIAIQKLRGVEEYYMHKLYEYTSDTRSNHRQVFLLELDVIKENFITLLDHKLFTIADYDYLKHFEKVVFEGAQGIMLDKDHGIYPNVTYSHTTSKNAIEICREIGIEEEQTKIYYITRCYQTRHGNGWMSVLEKDLNLSNNKDESNIKNIWQGNFRIGEIDYELINHALTIDNTYSKRHRKSLVVTCMDQRPDFIFEPDKLKIQRFRDLIYSYSPDSKDFIHHRRNKTNNIWEALEQRKNQ